MQLSKKLKPFCCSFTAFLKSTLNFEDIAKSDQGHSLRIYEIIDSEKRGYLNP